MRQLCYNALDFMRMGDFVRKLLDAGPVRKLCELMTKPAYLWALAILTAVSYAASLELLLYTVFALIVVFTALCGADLRPALPLLVFGYISVSPHNNPGQNAGSVFSGASGVYVICLGAVIAGALLYRILRDRKRLFRKNGAFTVGLLVLTGAYLLSGIGMAGYSELAVKNLIFALIQGAALLVPYWLMTGLIDWSTGRKDYWAWMGFAAGGLLVFEVLWIYLTRDVLASGVIDRTRIYTGWGMYNNLGGMLAFMIPFAFWLALYRQRPAFGYVGGMVMVLGVILSCSRSSMLLAVASYLLCCLLMPPGKHSTLRWSILLGLALAAGLALYLCWDSVSTVLGQLLDDTNMHSRVDIYGQGLGEFARNPIFGSSFYPKWGLSYHWSQTDITDYMPARWHNTPVQLLASTGLVGLVAYGFHRFRTVQLAIRHKAPADMLIAISIATILAGSLVDCHMFNVGPGMLYAILLAWLEKREE